MNANVYRLEFGLIRKIAHREKSFSKKKKPLINYGQSVAFDTGGFFFF